MRGELRQLSAIDALGLVAAMMMCIGRSPGTVFAAWTLPIAALLVVLAPGLCRLANGIRAGDRRALSAAAVAAWTVVAAIASGAPRLALVGTVGRDLSGVIVVGLIVAWAYAGAASDSFRALLPTLVNWMLAVSALVGVAQVMLGIEHGALALQFDRATGLSPNPVYFGGLMAGGALLAASSTAFRGYIGLGLVALFGFSANLSGSRAAVIAGLTGLLLYSARQWRLDRRRAVPLVSYMLGLVLAVVWGRLSDTVSVSTERAGQGGGRLTVWHYGWGAFTERPIAGWGFGRFRAAVQGRFSASFVREFAPDDLRQSWFDAHNALIAVVVATGLVGLALVVWFVAVSAWQVTGPGAWFAFVAAQTWLLQPMGLAVMPLVALLWGASSTPIRATPVQRADDGRVARTGAVIGVVAACYLIVADLRLDAALETGSAASVETSATMYPGDPVVADLVAQVWFSAIGDNPDAGPKAVEWSRRAVDAEPDRPYYWARLASHQVATGDVDAAYASLDEALRRQPWHPASWLLMFMIADEQGDSQRRQLAVERLCVLDQSFRACEGSDAAP